MKRAIRVRGSIVLAVLATLALVGCGKGGGTGEVKPGGEWLDDLRARIQEGIADKDHATQFIALVDEIEDRVRDFDVDVKSFYEQASTLDHDYDSRRADFDNLIDGFNIIRMAHRDRLFDLRFQMREIATDEEWAIIADIDESLLSSWQRGYEL